MHICRFDKSNLKLLGTNFYLILAHCLNRWTVKGAYNLSTEETFLRQYVISILGQMAKTIGAAFLSHLGPFAHNEED